MEITVRDRQSLLDVALAVLGSAEGVFALAARNGLTITSRLKSGQVLTYDLGDVVDSRVAGVYARQGIVPATELSTAESQSLLTATGRWFTGCIIPPLRRWEDEITTIGTEFDSNTTLRPATEAVADVVGETTQTVRRAAARGTEYVSESGQTLARIFSDQFNDVFA